MKQSHENAAAMSAAAIQRTATPTPNIINLYPLALFPAYFVPVFIAFHLFSLGALRLETSARTAGQIQGGRSC